MSGDTICERVREQLPECLAGRLEKAARERVIEHLETCSGCRAELAELGTVWRGLEAVRAPEPDAAMRTRFMETLEAYQAGMEQTPAPRGWRWWPAQPVWQMAIALGLLAVGLAGGRYAARPRTAPAAVPREMAQLEGQVEGLRQLVTLSLLQQQSPSERLRGVTYSSQMVRPDAEVEQALVYAVDHDTDVNVRLSAVDALEKYAVNPEVRRALEAAVPMQDSALVQIALIDLLVEVRDRDSGPVLRKLAQNSATDGEVRLRANLAVQKLEGPR